MYERLTDRARRVLILAQEEARMLGHRLVGTEHLLLGLVHEGEGIAAKVLLPYGSLDIFRERVEVHHPAVEPSNIKENTPAEYTPRAGKVLELALRDALQLGHNYIGTEHILLGMVREGRGTAVEVLVKDLDLNLSEIRREVIQLLSGYQKSADQLAADADKVGRRVTIRQLRDDMQTRVTDQPFTADELDTIAGFAGIDAAKVKAVAWLTVLKMRSTAS